MKNFLIYAISAFVFLFSASMLHAAGGPDQSGPGNGTDYVKVLFADAQYDVVRMLTPIDDSGLPSLGLVPEVYGWLTGTAQGASRFTRVKYWLHEMDLRFQQEPCTDFTKRPASICFFNDETGPYVMVSLQENKMTTKDQAMAMLIHEAGHFTGEKDHLLLDRVGVALVQTVKLPGALFADASSSDFVANPFQATEDCEKGTGTQAKALQSQVRIQLIKQCSDRGLACEDKAISYAFQGENNFQEMKVTCLVRGVLNLR
ncbi:MAG: hypothetical protein ACXVB9_19225 [Bdellovibrionota bacterium]